MGEDIQPEFNTFRMFSTASLNDPLAAFEAEAPPLGEAAAPSALAGLDGSPIALDQVLERLGYVSWVEAVAIVDALCSRLMTANGDERVPDLPQMSLTADGAIQITGRAPQGIAGPRLARTLHELMAHGAMPAPLRLFVSKWVALEEGHSIADFARELAYFVRPEREALIRAVYERASAIIPLTQRPASIAPIAENRPKERPRRFTLERPSPRVVMALALVVALLAVAMVSSLFWGRSRPASALRVSAGAASGSAGTDQVSAGDGQPGPASPGAPESVRTASQVTGRSLATSGVAAARARAPRGGVVARSAGSNDTASAGRGRVSDSPLVSGAAADAPLRPQDSVEATITAPRIYSSADTDVTPPAMRYPQMPPPLLSGVQTDLNTIELIITEAGTVERVRLVSTPRRMADMMLLSGAKMWTFEPASRGGQPVRYRLLLSWNATP